MQREQREFGTLVNQIKGEYREMPGLCVTLHQACRLWHVDSATCDTVLDKLVRDQFLRRTSKGLFIRN